MARYTATVEREAGAAIDPQVRAVVATSLDSWQGEQMPLMPSWVDGEISGLEGDARTIASFAIQLAKAPYRVGEKLSEEVLEIAGSEEEFVRILAWASFTGARRFAQILAAKIKAAQSDPKGIYAYPSPIAA